MIIQPTEVWRLFKASIKSWSDDRAPSMGAALAYYTAFSLAPVLLIVITIAGLVFGREAAQGVLFGQIADMVGPQAGQAIQAMLENGHESGGGVLGTIVGIAMLIIGATTVFVELQDDLDRIWKAEQRTGSGIWNFIRTRMLSFGMILAIGFVLIVSFVVTSLVAAMGQWWSNAFVGMEAVLQVVNFLVSFGIITLLFAMIYKILPNVTIPWSDVWIGAGVTSLLFSIGKFLIGLYIGKSAVASSYGAAGAFVVLLLWIYYSTQIFLLGAEFTYNYSHDRGSRAGQKKAVPESQRAPHRRRAGDISTA